MRRKTNSEESPQRSRSEGCPLSQGKQDMRLNVESGEQTNCRCKCSLIQKYTLKFSENLITTLDN